jgi:drug/metabolite transporter (DMT)-like permease
MFLLVPVSQALGWFLRIFFYRRLAIMFLWVYIFPIPLKFNVSFRPSLLMLLISIGLFDISAFFSYSLGVRTVNASLVAPVAASFPLITILLAKIFLKEKMSASQTAGIIGIILGLILISQQ